MNMKNTLALVISFLTSTAAFAALDPGTHVLFSTSGHFGSSISRVATVLTTTKTNSLIIQEVNYSSKYGANVYGSDVDGHMVPSYGIKEVLESEVVKETKTALRNDGSTLTAGSQIRYRYGRGRTVHVGRVLYAFANGQVAVISEEDYAKYKILGDNIFVKQVVTVSVR